MSPTTTLKKPPKNGTKKAYAHNGERRLLHPRPMTMEEILDQLFEHVRIGGILIRAKTIDLDWENHESSTNNILPSPRLKGLYPGDYVVWSNHTDRDIKIQFIEGINIQWPFTGERTDILVPKGADSSPVRVASRYTGTFTYTLIDVLTLKDYGGTPGGPGVVIPGG